VRARGVPVILLSLFALRGLFDPVNPHPQPRLDSALQTPPLHDGGSIYINIEVGFRNNWYFGGNKYEIILFGGLPAGSTCTCSLDLAGGVCGASDTSPPTSSDNNASTASLGEVRGDAALELRESIASPCPCNPPSSSSADLRPNGMMEKRVLWCIN
jgi:hypothetical protein